MRGGCSVTGYVEDGAASNRNDEGMAADARPVDGFENCREMPLVVLRIFAAGDHAYGRGKSHRVAIVQTPGFDVRGQFRMAGCHSAIHDEDCADRFVVGVRGDGIAQDGVGSSKDSFGEMNRIPEREVQFLFDSVLRIEIHVTEKARASKAASTAIPNIIRE